MLWSTKSSSPYIHLKRIAIINTFSKGKIKETISVKTMSKYLQEPTKTKTLNNACVYKAKVAEDQLTRDTSTATRDKGKWKKLPAAWHHNSTWMDSFNCLSLAASKYDNSPGVQTYKNDCLLFQRFPSRLLWLKKSSQLSSLFLSKSFLIYIEYLYIVSLLWYNIS